MNRASTELNKLPASRAPLFSQYGRWAMGAAVTVAIGAAAYMMRPHN
jgi:hypothetical protein